MDDLTHTLFERIENNNLQSDQLPTVGIERFSKKSVRNGSMKNCQQISTDTVKQLSLHLSWPRAVHTDMRPARGAAGMQRGTRSIAIPPRAVRATSRVRR
jgi:hypothetical protein